jgi:hypothetical protein
MLALALSIHSFGVHHFFILLIFFGFLLLRLEQGILIQTPSLQFLRALIHSLQMCLRTYVCRASRPLSRKFLSGTSGLPFFSRFGLPSQEPTSMTTESLSLHTPLILRSLDQFTIGHTLRRSTLLKNWFVLNDLDF